MYMSIYTIVESPFRYEGESRTKVDCEVHVNRKIHGLKNIDSGESQRIWVRRRFAKLILYYS